MDKLEIKLDAFGWGVVVLDDKDISNITQSISIEAGAGKNTKVIIGLIDVEVQETIKGKIKVQGVANA